MIVTRCIEKHELQAYCLGTLSPPDAATLERHLAECLECERALESLELLADELIVGLRDTDEAAGSDTDPLQVQRLIARVRGDVTNLTTQDIQRSRYGAQSQKVLPPETRSRLPITVDDFFQTLADSRLYATEHLNRLKSRFPGPATGDAISAARWMVESGHLTLFQASELCRGNARGLKLGDYHLKEQIGQGGMGFVYRARNVRMARDAAIKVLAPHLFSQAGTRERFRREVRAIAKLSHPNVVSAFDAGEQVGTLYLAMEYVDGSDLGNLVRTNGPLSVGRAVDYIAQAARGLACAHEQGIIHRDIKPANLLVSRDGVIHVSDLGVARFLSAAETDGITETGQILGTCDYMSPEQAFDTTSTDERSDIYSLAWTLYYLLTGSVPFPDASRLGKLVSHRDCPIPSLRSHLPDTPDDLDQLFQKMVAKRPEDRPRSMSDVADALLAIPSESKQDAPPAFVDHPPVDLDTFFSDLDTQLRESRETQIADEVQASRRGQMRRRVVAAMCLGFVVVALLAFPTINSYRFESGNSTPLSDTARNIDRPLPSTDAASETEVAAEDDPPVAAPDIVEASVTNTTSTAKLIGEIGQILLPQRVNSMVLSLSRDFGYTGNSDNVIYAVDLTTRTVAHELVGHENPISHMAISRDETRLASCAGDRTVRIWNLQNNEQQTLINLPYPPFRIAFMPDNLTVAVTLNMQVPPLRVAGVKNPLACSSLMLMNSENGAIVKNISDDRATVFWSVAVSPDGNKIAAGDADGVVLVFDNGAGVISNRFRDHRGPVHALKFLPDGKRLLSGGNGGWIFCRKLSDGEITYRRAFRHGIKGIDLSPDESRMLLDGTIDVRVLKWPVMEEQSLTILHGHQSPLSGLRFWGDNRAVSSSWDGTVRIWQIPANGD